MQLGLRFELNPIVVKELRSRMRGIRAFVILTGVLLLLAGASYALYLIVLATSVHTRSPVSPMIGQTLFVGLATLELMMVCFLTPAVTAGAISGERENQTYEMLLATPLRPASILRGKLFSALSYVLMIVFAAVPLSSLIFIFGGVAPRDMLKALVILVAVAVMLGVIGVFVSTWLKRTVPATVVSYLFILSLFIGPSLVYILHGMLRQAEPPNWLLILNPLSALHSALSPSMPTNDGPGIFWGLSMAMSGRLGLMSRSFVPDQIPRPLYHYSLPIYGLITIVFYLLSVRLVQPVSRWRLRWKEVLVALLMILALLGAAVLAFGLTAHRYGTLGLSSWPTPTPAPMPVEEMAVAPAVVRLEPEFEKAALAIPTEALPEVSPLLTDQERTAIYALVVHDLFARGQPLADWPDLDQIYLLPQTQDSMADPKAPQSQPHPLPPSIQKALVSALDDLPANLVWDRPEDESAPFLILGNIHVQEDGSALISASLRLGELGTLSRFYTFKQEAGEWLIAGGEDGNE